MNWDKELVLLAEIEEYDNFNKPRYNYVEKTVFCNKLPVKRTEFYQAQTIGYKIEKVFEVKTIDFDEDVHSHVKYNNKIYRILRSYETTNEKTELNCIRNNHDG